MATVLMRYWEGINTISAFSRNKLDYNIQPVQGLKIHYPKKSLKKFTK